MTNGSNFTNSMTIIMSIPTVIDINLDKQNQGLHYDPFMVSLDRCIDSCNYLW